MMSSPDEMTLVSSNESSISNGCRDYAKIKTSLANGKLNQHVADKLSREGELDQDSSLDNEEDDETYNQNELSIDQSNESQEKDEDEELNESQNSNESSDVDSSNSQSD